MAEDGAGVRRGRLDARQLDVGTVAGAREAGGLVRLGVGWVVVWSGWGDELYSE